ncbi:MAG: putative toxin-antitoxin system toxin component, PIN family [Deltaproteobacteria bacterium]|nr:putative toxin-antitoxin system toxin component, PIN family [Deltaproteobacteria bacterium]
MSNAGTRWAFWYIIGAMTEPLRIVVDTNVVVSALWKPGSVPARALERVFACARVVVDDRILAEYRRTLEKPKLRRISQEACEALLLVLERASERVVVAERYTGPLDDEDDRAFVEVALAGRAHLLVTGNLKDFPSDAGFEVVPPAHLLATLEGR